MNIFFYHQQNPSKDINQGGVSYNKLYVEHMLANIAFTSKRFPKSKIFFINDQCHAFPKNLSENVTLIDLNKIKNPSLKLVRHFNFLKNYFHIDENSRRLGNYCAIPLTLSFFERWFYIYNVLTSCGIENFVGLDSDCILLEDMSSHDYKKIGINHPPSQEDCWPNSLTCSTANLNKFLDFICFFYEGVQKQKNKEKYINSFFDKPRTAVCDMALWYLFKKQNPDLFVNNLTIDPDNGVHDWGLGHDATPFTTMSAQKYNPQGALQTVDIKQIFYTEDGVCFKKKDTKELIKIISLHFSPGTLKFDMIPFIDEYEKIYSFKSE
jgi:hypothetical protein